MNHVKAEQDRDAKTALLDCYALVFTYSLCSLDVKDCTHATLTDLADYLGLFRDSCNDRTRSRQEIGLTNLFGKRHLRHQVIDKLVFGIGRLLTACQQEEAGCR